MKRRDFIKLSLLSAGAFGLSVYSDPLFAMAGNPRKKLVFIFLKGGADVLSMFPPVKKTDFRDSIDNCKKYNGHLKIHPSLGLSEDLIKNLLIFTHTGVKENGSRSHFVQIEQIEKKGNQSKGYFARALGNLKGVAIGSNVPKSFMGADVPLISNLSDIKTGFDLGKVSMARHERLGLFKTSTNNVLKTLVPSAIDDYDNIESGFYNEKSTGSEFEDYCKTAAALTQPPKDGDQNSFQPSIITIDFGGWDDHIYLNPNDPGSDFSTRLKTLNDGLVELYKGMSSETIVVVMSEFGRTLCINPSKGADHGVGSAMMVFGKDDEAKTLFKDHKFSQSWDFNATEKSSGGDSSIAFAVKHDCFEVLDKIIDGHVKKAA
jgi:uncharacterized protein (DUF1501 family)